MATKSRVARSVAFRCFTNPRKCTPTSEMANDRSLKFDERSASQARSTPNDRSLRGFLGVVFSEHSRRSTPFRPFTILVNGHSRAHARPSISERVEFPVGRNPKSGFSERSLGGFSERSVWCECVV